MKSLEASLFREVLVSSYTIGSFSVMSVQPVW
jgi:hypothetical protein